MWDVGDGDSPDSGVEQGRLRQTVPAIAGP